MNVNIKLLRDYSKIPHYAHIGDAGADLFSSETIHVAPGDIVAVPTGVAMEIPESFVGYINPKSGLAMKGMTVLNAPGTIDSGYRGEIKVIMINHSNFSYHINRGDKIAQMVFHKFHTAWFEPVDELNETSRGTGGFGSTGQ